MKRDLKFNLLIFATTALFACSQTDQEAPAGEKGGISPVLQATKSDDISQKGQSNKPSTSSTESTAEKAVKLDLPASAFKTVEWTDLMPKEDIEALLNPPSYVNDVEDGSYEDQISNQLQSAIGTVKDDPYQQALVSTQVIAELNDQAVRIPGFIVPLEFNDNLTITEFFLVPFFGACIHVPPPPPNQIIYVSYPPGFKLDVLYDPVWISGVLKTSLVTNSMATAAYRMQMQSFEPYIEK